MDVSTNMRGILVDWLVEVAEEYKLVSDTLYITVSYIDRYLSLNALNRQRLQLFGVSKYEEINPPNVEDFCYITNNTYRKDEDSTLQLECLGCYLAELSLLDYGCVKFLLSMVATSVIFLARFIIQPKMHHWSSAVQEYSGYKASDLEECVLIIHDLYLSRRGGALQAIREQYKQHKEQFKCVATMPTSPEIPASYFEDVQEVDVSYVEDPQVSKLCSVGAQVNGAEYLVIGTLAYLQANPPLLSVSPTDTV
ncbi:Cyclin A3,1 [Gossypium australe]|uniref:Cyclin A3,1 n=1 Tax=Gossypium australe TaxID=47621 RepID=A0A5B6X6H3_9ROSI|nr:Cyclin A3,1 [Gossypium australe]